MAPLFDQKPAERRVSSSEQTTIRCFRCSVEFYPQKENIIMRANVLSTASRKPRLRHLLAIVGLVLALALGSAPAAYAFPAPSGCIIAWGYDASAVFFDTEGVFAIPADLSDVIAIAAGTFQVLALKSDGTVVSWPDLSPVAAVFDLPFDTFDVPAGLSGVTAIAAGNNFYPFPSFHSLALKSDGTVVGWGDITGEGVATPPAGLSNVVAIATGNAHSLALKSDGTVVGWGDDQYGQATPPAGLSDVVAISAGQVHSLALRSDGTVVGWGDDELGQATPPAGLSNVVAISAGISYGLALLSECSAANQPPVVTSDQPIWYATSVPGVVVATGAFFDPDGDSVVILASSDDGGFYSSLANVEQSCYGCSSGTWTAYYSVGPGFSEGWFRITFWDEQSDPVTIQVPVNLAQNSAPDIAANNASVTVDEGETATNSGTVSDPDNDPVTLSASIGTVVNHGDGAWSWSLATTDGPAAQTVTITADDGNGGTAQTTFDLTVNNVAPTVNAGPDQTVFRNAVVTVSGSWSDPAGAADNPYAWSWDLTGDTVVDESGAANYGDTVVRTTSFVVDGVATLTFSVTDKDGASASDTVQITVVNRTPVANNQSVSTDEDTPLPITLTASDADNDTLVYTLIDLPDHGSLSGAAPNLTYTPDPDYFAPSGHPDSFTFQVNDGLVDSNIATVSINVLSVNDPPVAVDDTATTLKNVPVTIAVQANDSAGPANEDQTLTTTAVTTPANGATVINPDGSVTYTPNFNFFGIDSFAYTVCDSEGSCATATVTVLVEWTNAPPTAVDDSVTTNEETPVTFDVLTNDSDVDGNLNPASVTVVSSPSNGALVHNGNGSFTYTPAAGFSGVDSFVYEVCDTEGLCASATVTITVLSINKAPVCTDAAPSVSVLWPPNHQFVPVTINGVTDIEGDPITIAIISIFQDEPTNGLGDGDTSPDGQGIGSSAAQVRAERAGGGNGRFYHISFSASDGKGGSCSGVVKVSVPKSMGKNGAAVDDGPLYNSTLP